MRNDYLSKISFFAFVVVYSAFMGTLAYMAMIANFNSPTNGWVRGGSRGRSSSRARAAQRLAAASCALAGQLALPHVRSVLA